MQSTTVLTQEWLRGCVATITLVKLQLRKTGDSAVQPQDCQIIRRNKRRAIVHKRPRNGSAAGGTLKRPGDITPRIRLSICHSRVDRCWDLISPLLVYLRDKTYRYMPEAPAARATASIPNK